MLIKLTNEDGARCTRYYVTLKVLIRVSTGFVRFGVIHIYLPITFYYSIQITLLFAESKLQVAIFFTHYV